MDIHQMVADAGQRILADHVDPMVPSQPVDHAALWAALDDAGLTAAGVAEPGEEITPGDAMAAFALARVAGQCAAPVPLVETMIVRRGLAHLGDDAAADIGRATLAPVRMGEPVAGAARLRAVPFAQGVDTLVVVVGRETVHRLPGSHISCHARGNDVGAARCDVTLPDTFSATVTAGSAMQPTPAWADDIGGWFAIEGAAFRAMQMTGALETVLKLAVDYANERTAFGRKIGKFQAVQQQLARLAGEVAAAQAAATSAADALANGLTEPRELLLEVASAKIRVADAAATGLAIAHQVHGAIGVSQEHALQTFARHMIGWRDDFGAPALWAERLGRVVADGGGRSIWPLITTR